MGGLHPIFTHLNKCEEIMEYRSGYLVKIIIIHKALVGVSCQAKTNRILKLGK